MARRIVFVPLFLLLFFSAHAAIRRVPAEYTSIQAALSAVQSNDTILLAPGHYTESITRDPFPTPLTIASNFLFSQDSSDITSTRWSPDSLRCFLDNVTSCKLSLTGIAFTAPAQPAVGNGIFTGRSDTVFVNSCHIQGVFDNQWGVEIALIHVQITPSYLEVNDCRIFGDTLGYRTAISTTNGAVSRVTRTIVQDRTDWRFPALNLQGDASVIQCHFIGNAPQLSMRGKSLIDSCKFENVGHWAIHISSGQGTPQDYQIIRDCIFENTVSTRFYPVIGANSDATRTGQINFIRVAFFGGNGTNGTCRSIIESSHKVRLNGCRFENITGFQCIGSIYRLEVDSSTFQNNSCPIFARIDLHPRDSAKMHNTNFENNSRVFTVIADNALFDSVYAQNCWWGDSTGPLHALNPNGLGDSLPSYVNPFPFRTTPVFPENGVNDPGTVSYSLPNTIELLSPYPNPFNASVTIRFRLPHPGDASITIYDVTGREVATLQRGYFTNIEHSIQWRPQGIASGSYWIKAQSGNKSKLVRIVHQK